MKNIQGGGELFKLFKIVGSMVAILSFTTCNESQDRQELLDRFRGLGTYAEPLVSKPSDGVLVNQAKVSVIMALPLETTANVIPYLDESSTAALPIAEAAVTIDAASFKYTNYNKFQLMAFEASVVIPDIAVLRAIKPDFNGIQARYGFLATLNCQTACDGKEREVVIGNLLVFPDGAKELDFKNPELVVPTPQIGATLSADSEAEVFSVITDHNTETVKSGWFVTGGKIVNRRARKTVWQTPATGPHSLVVTARGKKSRGFAVQVIEVNVK
jgi:hypothetical protein